MRAGNSHIQSTDPSTTTSGTFTLDQRGEVGGRHCGSFDVTLTFTTDGTEHTAQAIGTFSIPVEMNPLPGGD